MTAELIICLALALLLLGPQRQVLGGQGTQRRRAMSGWRPAAGRQGTASGGITGGRGEIGQPMAGQGTAEKEMGTFTGDGKYLSARETALAVSLQPSPRTTRATKASAHQALTSKAAEQLGPAGLADLVRIALSAGIGLPAALTAAGGAANHGELERVGNLLAHGTPWRAAWPQQGPLRRLADDLAESWLTGTSPAPILRATAARERETAKREAHVLAAKLGVRLVLPLGVCFLPAFFLLGIAPLVLAVLGDIW